MCGPPPCAKGTELFSHCIFVHRGRDEYLRGILAFIEGGHRAGQPVIVVVPTEKLELLHAHLGREAANVQLFDMTAVGRNPARLIPCFVELVRAQRGQHVRFVGEPVWAERPPEEVDEAIVHEALCNIALADMPVSGLCPYDEGALDPQVISAARAAHPVVGNGTETAPNAEYVTGERWPELVKPLGAPPPEASRLPFAASDLPEIRRAVDQRAAAAGLDPDRRGDLVMAVNEIATNSIKYAGGGGELRVWSSRGRLLCEIHDPGHIEDPLPGRVQPPPAAGGRRGLWLANQLCELVQIRTAGDGTTIRMGVPLAC